MSKVEVVCKKCRQAMKRYDGVERIVRRKGNKVDHIIVERYRCPKCGSIHRVLPDSLYPYKQYESDIIDGVIEGLIDSDTLGFEDYPCEMTMKRWRKKTDNCKFSTEFVFT